MSGVSERVTELSPKQRAYFALKEMQAKLDEYERAKSEPIAIVGMGCRFPGADGPDAFWQLLKNGVDAIREVPKERYDVDEFYDPDLSTPGSMNTRWGGYLDRADQFDAGFFGISVREAASVDPQQRLLLEVSWEALEHAGLAASQLAGSQTGVYIGISGFDYALAHAEAPTRGGTGLALSIAANRLSYSYDLRGPSMIVDTACSSSLVAVDLAAQSLRNRDVDMALAGAVNILCFPYGTVALSQAGFMAPDGRCKTFDAAADGYVRGEGCGIVVLKRLSDAIANGHDIIGLVLGVGVSSDGRSNGLTAPNGLSQQAATRAALRKAKVNPRQISYVEAHGTGTSLGDVVEVEALWSAMSEGRGPDEICHIGSVKTNIGHIEPASGIAGLIKVLLSLKNQQIPPNLHLKQINPNLRMDPRLHIPTSLQPWPRSEAPRYAGISAFGFGGTNSHAIVSDAPVRPAVTPGFERPVHLLTLSGKTQKALTELARRYARHVADHPTESLADICFTANSGRSHFEHRLVATASSSGQMHECLSAFAQSDGCDTLQHAITKGRTHSRIGFKFSDDAGVRVGAVRQLFDTQPTFRKTLQRCDELLRTRFDRSLLSALYPATEASGPLDAAFRKPAALSIQYALAQLWQSWGIEPSAVHGQGAGEYAAACVAGVFSWEDALALCAGTADHVASGSPRIHVIPPSAGEDALHSSCDFVIDIGPDSEWTPLLSSVSSLHLAGVAIDWKGFDRDYPRRLLALPTYPFERKRCWLEPSEIRAWSGPMRKVEA